MNTFDTTIFHWLNHFAGHNVIVDDIMKFLAQYALEIYAVVFILAWFLMPKRAQQERHALVMSGLSGILALLINVAISSVYFRPRPFKVLPHGAFTQLIAHPPDASFPSDHVAGGAGFSFATWGRNIPWVSWIFTILTILVAIARVYVGVHWPTDVLGGFLVGIISSLIVWRFSRFVYPLTRFGLKMFRQ